VKSGRQEHDGLSPATWHAALGPHGEGWHGFVGAASGGGAANKKYTRELSLVILLLLKLKKKKMMDFYYKCINYIKHGIIFLRIGWHLVKGSPINPDGQLHMGL